jgi:hypothetical protein
VADGKPARRVNRRPGHDAEVIGTEPCVIIDWMGMVNYARRR